MKKHRSSFMTVAAAVAVAFSTTIAPAPAQPPVATNSPAKKNVEWSNDLETALRDAGKENKRVLLRFSAEWCGPCRVMDIRVWPDPGVEAALEEKFLPVEYDIDSEAGRELGRKYAVQAIPAVILLDAEGNELSRGGFMSPPELIQFLAEPENAKVES